jgi:hypothetical protein
MTEELKILLSKGDRPTMLVAALRNVLPHLVNNRTDAPDGQPDSVRAFLLKLDALTVHLERYEKMVEILSATTWFEGIHPDNIYPPITPAQAPVKSDLDQLKEKLVGLLGDPHVKDAERSAMLAGINRLDSAEKVQSSLGKLTKTIADRQAAANQALTSAHEVTPVQLTPQQIRDAKQAEQYGAQGDLDPVVQPGAKKTRSKKPAGPVEPVADVTQAPDQLQASGQEGELIDPAGERIGSNLYASLAQKTEILKLCQDPKITTAERSKMYLAINKISYADADKSLVKMRAAVKDRPAPGTARQPVPPATDPAPVGSVAPAYDPEKMPFEQN